LWKGLLVCAGLLVSKASWCHASTHTLYALVVAGHEREPLRLAIMPTTIQLVWRDAWHALRSAHKALCASKGYDA
jgi:alkylhydroperoxidase/carboxymuconolactone decarboxylase family protein YurZ